MSLIGYIHLGHDQLRDSLNEMVDECTIPQDILNEEYLDAESNIEIPFIG